MHVILLTSLFGEKQGNVGDKLPVASQEEAAELVRLGIARYDTEAELKRQLAEYQAREQAQLSAAEPQSEPVAPSDQPPVDKAPAKQVKGKNEKA